MLVLDHRPSPTLQYSACPDTAPPGLFMTPPCPRSVSQEAICLSPEWSRGYLRAGRALTHLERYAEAKVALGLGLEIEPGNKAMRNALEHAEWVRRLFCP